MATTHDTDYLEGAWPVLLEQNGETVTYTPASTRVAASVSVIVHRDKISTESDDRGRVRKRMAMVSVDEDTVAAPVPRDKVTFDGFDWFVVCAQKDSGVSLLTLLNSTTEVVGNPKRNI